VAQSGNSRARDRERGTLFVVATPIGNLDDVSPRALRVLREADRIAAEDTRRTGAFLRRFGIHTPLSSYYDAAEARKVPALLEELLAGRSIALVCDAGTPLLSDPGYRLVRAALEAGIRVVPIPGPSAVTALLSVCGLPTDRFVFEGFLPLRPGRRRRRLEALAKEPRTIVLFEAPHRLEQTLREIEQVLGDREIAVGRELTKVFEEVRLGRISEIRRRFAENPPRGEIAIAVRGCEGEAEEEEPLPDLSGCGSPGTPRSVPTD
jgi:16S rRNA (cytidine1402-2'-O)-methyltransferase